nr:hypothetical protein [Tanacetum cinerariifolium]
MSRDVFTVGSTMRILLLYRGEYSQWVERFMNYLEEQTDGEAMINSIKNGDQPLLRVTQVSIARTSSTKQPPFKKTAKDLWDALARHMLGDVNDVMGSKKKTVVVTSDPLALIAEKTKDSKSKEKVVVGNKMHKAFPLLGEITTPPLLPNGSRLNTPAYPTAYTAATPHHRDPATTATPTRHNHHHLHLFIFELGIMVNEIKGYCSAGQYHNHKGMFVWGGSSCRGCGCRTAARGCRTAAIRTQQRRECLFGLPRRAANVGGCLVGAAEAGSQHRVFVCAAEKGSQRRGVF